MSLYPDSIARLAFAPRFAGPIEDANAVGTDASFACGAFVRFELAIDPDSKKISAIGFRSNGCGYMIAAAETCAAAVANAKLTELHECNFSGFEELAADRMQCAEVARHALKEAFARFRQTQLEEFPGEKALICTCFGISEELIERCGAQSVEEVGERTNAGTGCGSCRMLIAEIIDSAMSEL